MAVNRSVPVWLTMCFILVLSQPNVSSSDANSTDQGSTLSVIEEMVTRITEQVMTKLRNELEEELSGQQQCCENLMNSSHTMEEKMDACIARTQPQAATTTASPSSGVPECPPGLERFEDHCYLFELTEKRWDEARKTCRQQGAYLVSVNTQDEQDFLVTQIQRNYLTNFKSSFWLGLLAVEDSLLWSDGTNLTYSNWYYEDLDLDEVAEHLMQSTNDRMCFSEQNNYKWEYNLDYQSLFYICELELPNSEGNTASTPVGTNGCVPGYLSFGDHCYSFEMKKETWVDAKQACEESSYSYLVSINTEDEQNFLESQLIKYYDLKEVMYFWTGLTAVPGKLEWLDNSNVNYTAWQNPAFQLVKYDNVRYDTCLNGRCKVSIFRYDEIIYWHPTPRNEKHFYICEMDSV